MVKVYDYSMDLSVLVDGGRVCKGWFLSINGMSQVGVMAMC